jgi:hypothetical protein
VDKNYLLKKKMDKTTKSRDYRQIESSPSFILYISLPTLYLSHNFTLAPISLFTVLLIFNEERE